jgi:hypothetical protein
VRYEGMKESLIFYELSFQGPGESRNEMLDLKPMLLSFTDHIYQIKVSKDNKFYDFCGEISLFPLYSSLSVIKTNSKLILMMF